MIGETRVESLRLILVECTLAWPEAQFNMQHQKKEWGEATKYANEGTEQGSSSLDPRRTHSARQNTSPEQPQLLS
jgi:hypothetical protein